MITLNGAPATMLLLLVNSLLLLWVLTKVKGLFISGTVMIDREVELQGEKVIFTANIYAYESQDKIFSKINNLGEAAMQRKAFLYERFQDTLAKEQENNLRKIKKDG